MAIEIAVLAWASLLGLALMVLGAAIGSERPAAPQVERARRGHLDALVLYGAAAAVITFSDRSTALTQLAALAWLGARAVHLPLLLVGWSRLAGAAAAAGHAATLFILLKPLLPG